MIPILLSNDPGKIGDLLDNVKRDRQLDVLVQSIVGICKDPKNGDYLVSRPVLEAVDSHFAALSALSAQRQAEELLAFLQSDDCNCKGAVMALFRSLVEQMPLLNANRLRELLRGEVVQLCVAFWDSGQRNLAAQLTLCILQTLLMELAYLEGVQEAVDRAQLADEAKAVWAKLEQVQDFRDCPLLQLSTALLCSAIGDDEQAVACAKRVVKRKLFHKIDKIVPVKDGISYNSALFDLLSRNLFTLCHLHSNKLIEPMFGFLAEHAENCGKLESLLHNVAKNPLIRCSDFSELVQSAILRVVPSSSIQNLNIWPFETDQNDQGAKKKERLTKQEEDQLSWDLLLSMASDSTTAGEERLAQVLIGIPNTKIDALLRCDLPSDQYPPELCLQILHSIAELKKTLQIPIRAQFIELMLAERDPKIWSLKLACKLLEMHSSASSSSTDSDDSFQLADFVSFCLAMFRPLDRLPSDSCSEVQKRDFLLAELAFLRIFLYSLPQMLTSLAPLILQIIPEFFVRSTFYRQQLRDSKMDESCFADRLEHALSLVCREIVRRKKAFHKLLPFAISGSLTGERELRYPMYLLLTALDDNDLAFLSSNLPTTEKRKFALLQTQFYEKNRIIG